MFAILLNPFLQVFFLSDIGRISLDDVVRRVLSFVLSNDVALQFNFIGRQDKKEFWVTKFYEVIFGLFLLLFYFTVICSFLSQSDE